MIAPKSPFLYLAIINQIESASLETILDEYWKRKVGSWGKAAIESYGRYKRRLLEHFGENTPIKSITFKSMEELRDKLKSTGNKGKPVAEKTVNLHFELYGGLFNHAIQTGRIVHSPISGTKYSDKRNQQALNDPFSKEDLQMLFHSKEYNQDLFKKSWMFWIPVLLLYTGARLEEICQLTLTTSKP